MDIKFLLRALLLVGFLCFSTRSLHAQDILKSKDLSTFKVDNLTDDDITKFKQQLQQSGLTETQAEQLALQRGLPSSELSKLRAKLASSSNNNAKSSSITSRAISRVIDTLDNNNSIPVQDIIQERETSNKFPT